MRYEPKEKEYNQYVEAVTPVASKARNCLWAFLIGGVICTIGQGITNLLLYMGCDKEDSASYTSILLVLASVILTGCNLYKKDCKIWRCGNTGADYRICKWGLLADYRISDGGRSLWKA